MLTMVSTQDKIDTFYVAIDKLNSIKDDIRYSVETPFADNDDPIWEDWKNAFATDELCEFMCLIDNAATFASKAIHRLEDNLTPQAVF